MDNRRLTVYSGRWALKKSLPQTDGVLRGLKIKIDKGSFCSIIETVANGQPEGYFNMIETESLVLDKAKFSDWKEMYCNVWSRPESAKYMAWNLTESEESAKIRIMKTIEFQKEHDTWVVYEKSSGKAIGFAGVEKIQPYICQEAGICLGPDYVGKGFGKQILQGLIRYCKEEFGVKEFIYSTREENRASVRLAKSSGFTMVSSVPKTDSKDGHSYHLLQYSLKL